MPSFVDSDAKSKKKKKRAEKKQRSQSPFTKCLATIGNNDVESTSMACGALSYGNTSGTTSEAPPMSDYDLKVSKFLEMTRDEDNYEEKVRKFVEEASKYRKDRKLQEEKLKKKERKRSKKAKKESKKRKKDKKSKYSKRDKDASNLDNMEFREALK